MASTTPTNSIINLGLPAIAPDSFVDPQVKAAVEIFITGMNNFLREFERYSGVTQKDISLWSSQLPSDTLLRHQLGRLYVPAFENLIFGDVTNLIFSGGILKARKADATAGSIKPASGFCSTASGILAGSTGEIILSQGLCTITGVFPGDRLFLAPSPGQATTTPPTGAGQLEQFLGLGVAINLAYFDISMGQYIQH